MQKYLRFSLGSNEIEVKDDYVYLGAITMAHLKQGKSEGFDSCDRPSNLAQI